MSKATIFTVSEGKLTAMLPAAPESEDTMQKLIADHPEIITDRDGRLLLIRREQPISDKDDGGGRWSLDHLFVTREGIPVLVELKRAVDTRLRREVVGQMLDYAANATAYWKAGTIAQSFAATVEEAGNDPSAVLAEFLGDDEDADEFWQRVDDRFAAGRVKLVFVADVIPRELARIVEFMNEQMKADVRAVELNWFEGEGVKAFTPRIIGETERAQANKSAAKSAPPPISQRDWIETHLATFGGETVRAASAFMDLVADAGGHAEVTTAQGSIIAVFDLPGQTLYPIALSRYGKGMVQLNLSYLKSRPAFATDEARQALYDEVASYAGPLSTASIKGFPGFQAVKLLNPEVRRRLEETLRTIAAAAL